MIIDARDGAVKINGIDETRLSNDAIKGIVGHYNSELDKTDGAMPGVKIEAVRASDDKTIMQVPPSSTTIQVNKSPGDSSGGKVKSLLNTVANMKNSLVHEREHVKQNQAKDRKSKKGRELEAIDTQKRHSTWEGTTETYKKNIKLYEEANKKTK